MIHRHFGDYWTILLAGGGGGGCTCPGRKATPMYYLESDNQADRSVWLKTRSSMEEEHWQGE
jgi:hypothetical protein